MTAFSRAEADRRMARLQRLMADAELDGCLITQNVAIYYFTGSMQTGYLFVPASGASSYYVRRSMARAEEESLVNAAELGSLRQFGSRLAHDYPEVFKEGVRPTIGADLDVLPASQFLRLAEALPEARLTDASALLRKTRAIKSSYEIDCIEKAAEVAALALDEGLRQLHEGMTELELLSVIERVMREEGHTGLMRMRGYNQELVTGMVAAGEAAAEPTCFDGPAGGRGLTPAFPQGASNRPIRPGEPILIDIGCCIDGYVIDQTRTAVIGKLPPRLHEAYDAADSIIRLAEHLLKPGISPESLYEAALKKADEAGLSAHFMGYGHDQAKFLGHGIGLEVDEWPVLARGFREPLEAGMILAVEPKFTFPGYGVVGIENTYLVTETGCRALTRSPECLYEIPHT